MDESERKEREERIDRAIVRRRLEQVEREIDQENSEESK
jgi:hypothetical protein